MTFLTAPFGSSMVDSVDFSPCPMLPCQLVKGTNVTVTQVFKPVKLLSAPLFTYASGYKQQTWVNITVPESNFCHRVKCPVPVGKSVTYTNIFTVPTVYGEQYNLSVSWFTITEPQNHNFIATCVKVPVHIV